MRTGQSQKPLGIVPPAPQKIGRCSSGNDVFHGGSMQGHHAVTAWSDSDLDGTFGKAHGGPFMDKLSNKTINSISSTDFDGGCSESMGQSSATAWSVRQPTASGLKSKDLNPDNFHVLEASACYQQDDYRKSRYMINFGRESSKQKQLGTQGNRILNMPWSAPSMIQDNDLHSTNELSNFDVVARIRPLNDFEISAGAEQCMDIMQQESDEFLLRVLRKDSRERQPHGRNIDSLIKNEFSFRSCIAPDEGQNVVFEKCGLSGLIDDALNGINVTIFAYGQTGSGKTFTIHGIQPSEDTALGTECSDCNGIIPNSLRYLFQKMNEYGNVGTTVSCGASYSEIYNEGVYDLLLTVGNSPLRLKWMTGEGFCVPDLHIQPCNTLEDAEAVLSLGNRRRRQRSHLLNTTSSRSHTILTLYLHRTMEKSEACTSGKINFVDLAGSEKLKETCSESVTATKETTNINKSLFLLGKVIHALASGQSRNLIPYRESKLTKLLFGSMVSPSKCLMIACCSPSDSNVEESIKTLQYAAKARNIASIPTLHMNSGETIIAALEREVRILRTEISLLKASRHERLTVGSRRG